MSVYVIAKGCLSFSKLDEGDEIVQRVVEMMRDDNNIWNIDEWGEGINFELGGKNGVDYEPLEIIKEYLIKERGKNEYEFEIFVNEYSECDGGMYYSSEDEKEIKQLEKVKCQQQ